MTSTGLLEFFLGGNDLEMNTIRDLLQSRAGDRFHDRRLAWGARASAYAEEIDRCLGTGHRPVLVELEDDVEAAKRGAVIVDHHGDAAGQNQPTALHQVFALLGCSDAEWTRWYDLVAANDRAHIPGLVASGASREEISRIRELDRRAQGLSPADEQAAAAALRSAEVVANGRLTVVRLPHARTAAVTDRLAVELGGPGFDNLLVISPGEVNFFGQGELVARLDERFPGGWRGGALPVAGYWGHRADPTEVLRQLRRWLEEPERPRAAPSTGRIRSG